MGCTIELTSITYAIKAKDLLRKNRFNAKVEKSTGNNYKGCAYTVTVDKDCQNAVELLKDSGIKILSIH